MISTGGDDFRDFQATFVEATFNVREFLADALRSHQDGHLAEAERLYRLVLQLRPTALEALYPLGVLAHQTGRHALAVEMIGKAIGQDPSVARFHGSLGSAFDSLANPESAVLSYRRALALNPCFFEAYLLVGIALQKLGRLEAAQGALARALPYKSETAEAYFAIGNAFKQQGRLDAAVDCYNRAIEGAPHYVEAHNNLGLTLLEQSRFDEAVASYGRALFDRPDLAMAHLNLGIALQKQGKAVATTSFRRALILSPAHAEVLARLGDVLRLAGKTEEAVTHFGWAVVVAPDYAEAHRNRGILLLLLGRYEEGWPEYEWRWAVSAAAIDGRDFGVPKWSGEPLGGRTIVLHGEQGLGDAVQFSRYAPMVAALGGRVVLEVQRPLTRLLAGLAGVDRIVTTGEMLPPFEAHCPLMSLPMVFATRLSTIPGPCPYLTADPLLVEAWGGRIGRDGYRIGVVWHGNAGYGGNHSRSFPLRSCSALAKIPGARLISLQKTHGLDQLDALPADMPVERLGPSYDDGDFADTAAIIQNLDLVISCCTSVAHLAGALGHRTWLPVAAVPHWVWMLGRDDSPWYPNTRLFRQSTTGEWQPVFDRMAAELSRTMGMTGHLEAGGMGSS